MSKVDWDYTTLAPHYDKRPDYAGDAIDAMLALAAPDRSRPIADIGAGTGKLTAMLLARGYAVCAVEPNDRMREYGIRNTGAAAVRWSTGTGEETGLPGATFDVVTFGSSFNVTDRARTLTEVARIARPRGWFACLWNHRDLDDEVQRACEAIIRRTVPAYSYGARREDQAAIIRAAGLFEEPRVIEGVIVHEVGVDDFVEAWRSHATLERQAGDRFDAIVREIGDALRGLTTIRVPYTTRIWCARLMR